MKLSELVRYLNYLDQGAMSTALNETLRQAENVLNSITTHQSALPSFNTDLEEDFAKISNSINGFGATVEAIRRHIKNLIVEQESLMYAQSQFLYEDSLKYDTSDYILNRRLSMSDDQRHLLEARIRYHASWRWPGLLIRPAAEKFIEDFVPLDPLYLIDQSLDLLEPAVSKFEVAYQRRLRKYVIDEQSEVILHDLPDNQFGFIFANAFFNFKPLTLIQRYLSELYQKLRPGGTLVFTYNDCDLWQGVDLAERNFMCYTPGSKIQEHAELLGFVIKQNMTNPANAAWFEMSKPGELDGIRGGQSLAKIIPK